MKAFRLQEWQSKGQLIDVPVPEPKTGEVLLKVAGAGICHSDLHILQEWDDNQYHAKAFGAKPPFTLGHENAGWIVKFGPDTSGFNEGQAVLITGAGCGYCKYCARGMQNYCLNLSSVSAPGIGRDGGLAEYMLAKVEELVPINVSEPWKAAPLTDAGFTSYHAVKRVLPSLTPDTAVVVIGIGGLGHMAVSILKTVCAAKIIAVDIKDKALELAKELGADHCIKLDDDAPATIRTITNDFGASAVLDFVGVTPTLEFAAKAVAKAGQIVVCGLGGGKLELAAETLPFGATICFELGGAKADLMELIGLMETGRIHSEVMKFPLSEVQIALDMMERGEIIGRAVIVPDGH